MLYKLLINQYRTLSSLFPKLSTSGCIGLFFISPLLAFPYFFYGSYKGNRIYQVLFSLFCGLLSICFVPPRADLYRHYSAFFKLNNQNFQDVLDNLRFDVGLPFLQYAIYNVGLNFEIIRLFILSIPYLLFFKLYNYLKLRSEYNNYLLFLFCIFSVPFMELTLGIRYGFAISLISYVALKRSVLNKSINFSDIIILISGPCVHFSTIWYSILVLCKNFIPKNLKKFLVLILLVFLYLSAYQFDKFLQMIAFNNATEQLTNHYGADGAYGVRFISHNFIGSIPEYYSYFIVYIIILIFCINIPYNRKTVIPWCVILIWAFTHKLYGISARIDSILIVLCPIYIMMYSKYSKIFLRILILGAFLVALINWRAYTVSYSLYILFPPILILSLGYDPLWIQSHVDQTGTLFIYKR